MHHPELLWREKVPVVIAGGGPVGLVLSALLARYGVENIVIEADDGYCAGSRAICMSRRSQEILSWIGADQGLVDKGLCWVGGRSYFRDREVLHFQMPSDPTQRYAPMVNIQQYYAEELAHKAAAAYSGVAQVHWSSTVRAVRPHVAGVEIGVETAAGLCTVQADWLVAADGGRSTVREQLGLQLEGMQYDGKYVIVDIVQKTRRATERLAWFDPPSNPGSTLLMHRQPDDVWRIDYQIRDDEDPVEAVKPENVLPRVQSHLTMIGETEPWTPLWISIYNAKCLTLPDYRHGRVLFAGDAAHLVPIFGVRGLNSGLDDAGNLAWKLAMVQQGRAAETLLDSYSSERVGAARENIRFGAKSTEFMAPPSYGFRLLREAALRLATEERTVSSLLNPRQSTPIEYVHSPLNQPDCEGDFDAGASPGMAAPEAQLRGNLGYVHLTSYFGEKFVLLCFSPTPELADSLSVLVATLAAQAIAVVPLCIARTGPSEGAALIDELGQAHDRYDALDGTAYLLRPDGYVMARWRGPTADKVQAAMRRVTA